MKSLIVQYENGVTEDLCVKDGASLYAGEGLVFVMEGVRSIAAFPERLLRAIYMTGECSEADCKCAAEEKE